MKLCTHHVAQRDSRISSLIIASMRAKGVGDRNNVVVELSWLYLHSIATQKCSRTRRCRAPMHFDIYRTSHHTYQTNAKPSFQESLRSRGRWRTSLPRPSHRFHLSIQLINFIRIRICSPHRPAVRADLKVRILAFVQDVSCFLPCFVSLLQCLAYRFLGILELLIELR